VISNASSHVRFHSVDFVTDPVVFLNVRSARRSLIHHALCNLDENPNPKNTKPTILFTI
jgi:hypothetical protein